MGGERRCSSMRSSTEDNTMHFMHKACQNHTILPPPPPRLRRHHQKHRKRRFHWAVVLAQGGDGSSHHSHSPSVRHPPNPHSPSLRPQPTLDPPPSGTPEGALRSGSCCWWVLGALGDTAARCRPRQMACLCARGGGARCGGARVEAWVAVSECDHPWGHRGHAGPARAQHSNQCSAHLSQCLTPKHHSLLQPRLPHPCRARGPRVGRMATSPLPSQGSPTQGQKMGNRGDNWGKIGEIFARCDNVLSQPCGGDRGMRGGRAGAVGSKPCNLTAFLAVGASINLSPFTKIHQASVLAPHFCFSSGGGLRHHHIADPHNLHLGVPALCHGGAPRSSPRPLLSCLDAVHCSNTPGYVSALERGGGGGVGTACHMHTPHGCATSPGMGHGQRYPAWPVESGPSTGRPVQQYNASPAPPAPTDGGARGCST